VRDIYRETGVWDDLTHMWGPMAELAVTAEADAELDELLAIVAANEEFCPAGLLAQRAFVLGLRAARSGAEDAEPLLRDAIERLDAWGATVPATRARATLGAWLTTHGRLDEGRELVEPARATYTELGAFRWLDELETASLPTRTEASVTT
jgi:hypothetical protein